MPLQNPIDRILANLKQETPNPFEAITANLQRQRQAEAEAQLQQQQVQQQHMEELRKLLVPERDAQLAKIGGQFDPIIEQLLSQAQQPAGRPGDLNPSPWRDLSQAIANAFWMAQTGQKMEAPVDAREKRLAAAQAKKEQMLAQLRLMMEGKSKAEDRVTDAFSQQMSQGLRERLAAEAAKRQQSQFEQRMNMEGHRVNVAKGNLALRERSVEASEDRTAANAEVAALHQLEKERPDLVPGTAEHTAALNEQIRRNREERDKGSSGTLKLVAGPTGESTIMFVPPTRGRLRPPELPTLSTGALGAQEQETAPVPNPAFLAAGGRGQRSAAHRTSNEIINKAPDKWSYLSQVFDKAPPEVKRRNRTFVAGPIGADAYKTITFNRQRSSETRGALDTVAKVAEQGYLEFLSPTDFSNFFDLALSSVFDPTAGAVTADRVRNYIEANKNPQMAAKWNALPDSVRELYMKLGTMLNQYIKQMTGVAASSKEFGRLTMVQPNRTDPPREMAFKLVYNNLASAINQAAKGAFESGGKDLYKVFDESSTPFEQFVSDIATAFSQNLIPDGIGSGPVTANLSRADVVGFLNEPTILQAALLYDQAYQRGGPEEAAKITQRLIQKFSTPKNVLQRMNSKKDLFDMSDFEEEQK